jgi:hypothetical protein
MNRHQRRAAQRNFKVGDMVETRSIVVGLSTGELHFFWFEVPPGFTNEDGEKLLASIRGEREDTSGIVLHGPFSSDAVLRESERITLFGPNCVLREMRTQGGIQ